jgi:hypothetical protein
VDVSVVSGNKDEEEHARMSGWCSRHIPFTSSIPR